MTEAQFVSRHWFSLVPKSEESILEKDEKLHNLLNVKKTVEVKNRNDQDKHLTVHLIPYSWDKVGYKKTIDQSYTGIKNGIKKEKVSLSLDNVFYQLGKDASRRFTITQIKYFQMWWSRITPKEKENAKKIIQNGQVEFA